ncbi:MAG: S8 family serine peptidase [Candidatus Peregrinibacteria bacterium]
MKKKNKAISLLVGILLAGGIMAIVFNRLENSNEQSIAELNQLNLKYGLTSLETLESNGTARYISSIFQADSLKTDTVDLLKPEKDIILKLDKPAQSGDEDLRNIVFLELHSFADIEKIAEEYENLDVVQYAEPDFGIELSAGTEKTIPQTKADINLQNEPDTSDKEITVAVIDSGVDSDHPDLKDRLKKGWNTISNSRDVEDEAGHGTHITGIVLANSSAVKVMPLKFTNGMEGKMKNLIKAIKYAADNGADVINLSLGIEQYSKTLKEAIDYAEKKDVIVVAAAGNYKSEDKYYPAALENVISVAGLQKDGKKLYISNYGEWVDFSTTAQDIYSTYPNDGYGYGTGTSQAAPVISAVIADEIIKFSQENGEEPDFDDIYDYLKEISTKAVGKYADKLGGRIPNSYDK